MNAVVLYEIIYRAFAKKHIDRLSVEVIMCVLDINTVVVSSRGYQFVDASCVRLTDPDVCLTSLGLTLRSARPFTDPLLFPRQRSAIVRHVR